MFARSGIGRRMKSERRDHRVQSTALQFRFLSPDEFKDLDFAPLLAIGQHATNDLHDRRSPAFDRNRRDIFGLLSVATFDDARIVCRNVYRFLVIVRPNAPSSDGRIQLVPIRRQLFDLGLRCIALGKQLLIQSNSFRFVCFDLRKNFIHKTDLSFTI